MLHLLFFQKQNEPDNRRDCFSSSDFCHRNYGLIWLLDSSGQRKAPVWMNNTPSHLDASVSLESKVSEDPGDGVIKGGGSKRGTFKIKPNRLSWLLSTMCWSDWRKKLFKSTIRCRSQLIKGLKVKQHSSHWFVWRMFYLPDGYWPLTSSLSLFSVSVPVWLGK